MIEKYNNADAIITIEGKEYAYYDSKCCYSVY